MAPALGSPVAAQHAERFLLQGYGAYVPTSEGLGLDWGFAAAGAFGLRIVPRAWLMGGYAFGQHEGEDGLPDWDTQSYFGMLGYDIVPPGMNGNWIFYAGVGGVEFDPGAASLEKRAFLALTGGMKIIYEFGRHIAATLDLGTSVAFAEEEYSGGDVWFFPMGLGLALRF